MKKYKEWLTNEIEIMESETSENYPHEQMIEREVVLNLINQLDEPGVKQIKELDSYNDELIRDNNQLRNALDNQKVLSQGENINIVLDDLKEYIKEQQSLSQNVGLAHTSAGNDTHYRQYDYVLECINEYEPSDDLQNLTIPKQELPVIPKYVADWIAKHRDTFDLYPALKKLEDKPAAWKPWKRIYEWYRMNTHQFVNAYLTGEYEVEEEQKYYVIFPSVDENCKGFNYLAKDTYHNELWIEDSRTDGLDWEERSLFTEDEIRDLDKGDILFEHFAVKVEEKIKNGN